MDGKSLRDKLAREARLTGGLPPPQNVIDDVAAEGQSLVELVSRRSRNSSHYAVLDEHGNPTGQIRAIVHSKTIHFESAPGAGDWQAIETRPSPDSQVAELVAGDTFLGETADGHIYGQNADYATARATSTGGSIVGTTALAGQSLTAGPTHTVWRSYLSFDTSAIPDAATVTAATLYVCAEADYSTTDYLVQCYWFAWSEPLLTAREANYDGAYGGSATLEGTLRDTADGWADGTYYNMAVATAGINKTGDSKYTLVSGKDVSGTAPSGNEYVTARSADYANTASDPYLDITYYVLGTGSITAAAIVEATLSSSIAADAIVLKTISGSVTADAIIFKVITGSIGADSIVQKTIAGSVTAQAIVQLVQTGSITAKAVIHTVETGSVTAAAIIQKTLSDSITADSIIHVQQTGSLTAQAFLAQFITARAIVFKTMASSITGKSIVHVQQTGSITAKAVLVRGITARAIIFKTQTGSITTKAYVAWYSDYPTSITAWTDLADVDPAVNDSGSWFNKDFMDKVTVNVAATQTEWGANPQGVYTTVAERVAALETRALVMRFGNITAQAVIA